MEPLRLWITCKQGHAHEETELPRWLQFPCLIYQPLFFLENSYLLLLLDLREIQDISHAFT